VLGGGGFVGSAVSRQLCAQGMDCVAPLRGDERLWHEPLGHVIYAIGLTADFRTRPLDTVQAHVCELRRLIAEADFESLTYLSSTRVYAGCHDTCESATLRVNPNDPSDLYNLSKLTGEALCLHSGRPGMKVARLSNVVGPRRDADTFIDQLLQEAAATGRAVMRSAPDGCKDYIALADAATLLARMATSPATGIFNLASGEQVPGSTVARLMQEVLGLQVDVAPNAPLWDLAPINTQRVRDEFGFRPQAFADHFTAFLQMHGRSR
jgi:nucleoside-diphosphate-sugar epimerase